jgi:hypothetical protein
MRISAFNGRMPAVFVLSLALAGTACQTTTTTDTANINSNTSTTSTVSNFNAGTSSTTTTTTTGDIIDTREPDRYRANLSLKFESVGQQAMTLPPLTAEVSKNGTDRRIAVKLPGGSDFIYLDKADKRYVLLPAKKQYAELNPTSTGFEWQRLMTPGEIVAQLKRTSGVQKVGDDVWNGRPVTKYRIAGTAKTNTAAAGDVSADAFVYVDKETGLPLHTETLTQSSGDKAKGAEGKVITELTDITTNVDPTNFEIPPGYAKIDDAQVRQQVDKVMAAVIQIASQLIGSAQASSTPTASPTSTPTATPTTR